MSSSRDPERIAAARALIAQPKRWVAAGEMRWRENGGQPPGHKLIAVLETASGYQPAGLFVDIYYKPARPSWGRDKLSFTLRFNGQRILGIDDGTVGSHTNHIGAGRPLYRETIGFPHLHTVSDDGVYGYAEPLEFVSRDALWLEFVTRANIVDAPGLTLPTVQRELFT